MPRAVLSPLLFKPHSSLRFHDIDATIILILYPSVKGNEGFILVCNWQTQSSTHFTNLCLGTHRKTDTICSTSCHRKPIGHRHGYALNFDLFYRFLQLENCQIQPHTDSGTHSQVYTDRQTIFLISWQSK